jgi:PilZ domain-containing protein
MPTLLRNQASTERNRIWCNRVWPRRPLDLRARLLTRPAAGGLGVVVHGRTVDLSRSGAGVTVTCELAEGSEVVFCMHLPGSGTTLDLRAVITRRRGFRVGLEFVQPTAEQRLLLSALCQS